MSLLSLYLRYQRDWVGKRAEAPPLEIGENLVQAKRIVVLVGDDARVPPLTLPALRLLRRKYDNSRILLVCGASNVSAFRRERIVDKAILFQRKKGSALLGEIRKTGREVARLDPDLLFVLDGEADEALLALAYESQVPLRIGFGHGERYPFLNFEITPSGETPYLAQSLVKMVGALTGNFPDFLDDELRWRVPEPDARRADRLIHFWQPGSENLLVAIEPSGTAERAPDYAKYVAVARLLSKAYGARVMIVVEPEKKPVAEELERRLAFLEPYRAQVDDLSQAVAFLSRADLVVAANTPLFHYAVALGVPALGLFPERAPSWTIPPPGVAAAVLPLEKETTEEKFLATVDALGAAVAGEGG